MKNIKIIKEFQEFAIKGNVVDLATAVIVGGAFGKIVSSLVGDIIMPIIGLITGGSSFSAWKIELRPETLGTNGDIVKTALNLNAGAFIQNIIDFLIIAASVFMMVKFLLKIKEKFNKELRVEIKSKEEKNSRESQLLEEIRDILKKEHVE